MPATTYELLRGKDGIHDGDVGRREVGADGENEDARVGEDARVEAVCLRL